MNRILSVCCLSMLAIAFLAPVAASQEVKCNVIASGTYTTTSEQRVDAPGTPTGQSRIVSLDNTRFTSASHTVPARLGIRFGVRFSVSGLPASADVNLRKIVSFPPMSKPDGTVTKGYERTLAYKTNAEGAITNGLEGYGFDYPYEMVQGQWRIEMWYGNVRLTDQVFNVVAP